MNTCEDGDAFAERFRLRATSDAPCFDLSVLEGATLQASFICTAGTCRTGEGDVVSANEDGPDPRRDGARHDAMPRTAGDVDLTPPFAIEIVARMGEVLAAPVVRVNGAFGDSLEIGRGVVAIGPASGEFDPSAGWSHLICFGDINGVSCFANGAPVTITQNQSSPSVTGSVILGLAGAVQSLRMWQGAPAIEVRETLSVARLLAHAGLDVQGGAQSTYEERRDAGVGMIAFSLDNTRHFIDVASRGPQRRSYVEVGPKWPRVRTRDDGDAELVMESFGENFVTTDLTQWSNSNSVSCDLVQPPATGSGVPACALSAAVTSPPFLKSASTVASVFLRRPATEVTVVLRDEGASSCSVTIPPAGALPESTCAVIPDEYDNRWFRVFLKVEGSELTIEPEPDSQIHAWWPQVEEGTEPTTLIEGTRVDDTLVVTTGAAGERATVDVKLRGKPTFGHLFRIFDDVDPTTQNVLSATPSGGFLTVSDSAAGPLSSTIPQDADFEIAIGYGPDPPVCELAATCASATASGLPYQNVSFTFSDASLTGPRFFRELTFTIPP